MTSPLTDHPQPDPRATVPASETPAADVPFAHAVGDSGELPLVRLGGPDAAARFERAMLAFRGQSRWGFALYPWSEEQYADHALVLTPGGEAGVAVAADGMVHSLFSTRGTAARYGLGEPGVGVVLTDLAVHHLGATYLNCFDNGFTREFYERFGFAVTDRFPFDPEMAIPGWEYGVYAHDGVEPDFLVMRRP